MGKQRSVHNTYMTLPVIFIMISNHYPAISGHPKAWLLLAMISAGAVSIRYFFIQRHFGRIRHEFLFYGAMLIFGAMTPTPIEGRTRGARNARVITMSPEQLIPRRADAYARWVNFPWTVVERDGQTEAGDWNDADNARSAYRNRRQPRNRNENLGFRVVLPAPSPPPRATAQRGVEQAPPRRPGFRLAHRSPVPSPADGPGEDPSARCAKPPRHGPAR